MATLSIELVQPFKSVVTEIVKQYEDGKMGFVKAVSMVFDKAMAHHTKSFPDVSNATRLIEVDSFVQKVFVEDVVVGITQQATLLNSRLAKKINTLPWERGG